MKLIILASLIGAAFFVWIAASLLFTSSVAAEPSCAWATQPDGSTSGVCVGDDGRRYCVSCPAGTTPNAECPHVSCNG